MIIEKIPKILLWYLRYKNINVRGKRLVIMNDLEYSYYMRVKHEQNAANIEREKEE